MGLLRKRLFAIPAVAAALALLTSTAASAGPATVTPIGPVTFTNTGPVIFGDPVTGGFVSCDTYVLAGRSQDLPVPFVINQVSAQECAGPGGVQADVLPRNLPWLVRADSFSNGVTTGELTEMKLRIGFSDGCQVEVTGPGGGTGAVGASYSNSGQLDLGVSSNLQIHSVIGFCDPTLIGLGDPFTVDGRFQANPVVIITP